MTVFCEHDFCWGFTVVPNAESRDYPFSICLTRFPVCPKRIVYDFGCALYEYFLNRRAGFIADVEVQVDEFHKSPHKCPEPFRAKSIKDMCRVNTSIAEQNNSKLKEVSRPPVD